jgi:hypothetical protein
VKNFHDMTKGEQGRLMSEMMEFIHIALPDDAYPIMVLVAVASRPDREGYVISSVNGKRELLVDTLEKLLEQIKGEE